MECQSFVCYNKMNDIGIFEIVSLMNINANTHRCSVDYIIQNKHALSYHSRIVSTNLKPLFSQLLLSVDVCLWKKKTTIFTPTQD